MGYVGEQQLYNSSYMVEITMIYQLSWFTNITTENVKFVCFIETQDVTFISLRLPFKCCAQFVSLCNALIYVESNTTTSIFCLPHIYQFVTKIHKFLFAVERSHLYCMMTVLKLVILLFTTYRKTSNISRTLVGNKIVDNSDVVGASPIGAAPTTSSFST